MSHCYRCGRPLGAAEPRRRRKVATGGSVRTSYLKGRVRATADHFGMRVVCKKCARRIDFREGRLEAVENAKLAAAVAVLAILLAVRLISLLWR